MFGGTLKIIYPQMNAIVPPGLLDVSGYWTDRGMPEPDPVNKITILLDGGQAVTADKAITSTPGASVYSGTFKSPEGSFTLTAGAHTVAVTATDSLGSTTESVTFSAGQPPVLTALAGTCTAKGATILTNPVTIGLSFSQPSSVTITSFPPITPSAVSVSGLTLTTTITLVSSGTGTFNPADGSISIPDVILQVNANINGFSGLVNMTSTATVSTTLTTGSSSSPAFNDEGTPLQPSGDVTLVGDGIYSAPVFGLTDFAIALSGTVSPMP
jgi:hypothetical protein